ncbi:MAG TPA: hypothetical protein VD995_26650 [Azospirillum sp.]|nr:hypothetical protein [Azospirillum sp.]
MSGRSFFPATFTAAVLAVPLVLCAAPAPAAGAADAAADAAVLWQAVARTVATVARCADYDYDRRDAHLALLDQYLDDLKDVQERIETVLVRGAAAAGSRNPARETAAFLADAVKGARAAVDQQNQGHDIRFVKGTCVRLAEEYRGKSTLFVPLAERFPDESRILRETP